MNDGRIVKMKTGTALLKNNFVSFVPHGQFDFIFIGENERTINY